MKDIVEITRSSGPTRIYPSYFNSDTVKRPLSANWSTILHAVKELNENCFQLLFPRYRVKLAERTN